MKVLSIIVRILASLVSLLSLVIIILGYCCPTEFCAFPYCPIIIGVTGIMSVVMIVVGGIYTGLIGDANIYMGYWKEATIVEKIIVAIVSLLVLINIFCIKYDSNQNISEEVNRFREWYIKGFTVSLAVATGLLCNDFNYRRLSQKF